MTSGSGRLRFGLAIRRGPIEHVLHQGVLAARAGFDSIWYMDHLQGLPLDRHVFEPFSVIAALTQRISNVQFGIVATDTYRRHPALLAQILITLGFLAGGRMSLALGSGEAMNLRPFGFPEDRPIGRLREMFPALRGLSEATPEKPFSLRGEFHTFRDAFLQLPGASSPRLYLAGNGPKNREIAGALAEGWIPLMISPELYERDLTEIRAHGVNSDRDMDAFDPGYQLDFALAESKKAGRQVVAPIVKNLLLAFPKKAARLGLSVTHDYDWHDLLPRPGLVEEIRSHHRGIDDDVADRTSVFGTPEDCIEGIDRFHASGCKHLIIRSVNPVEEACRFFSEHVFHRYRN